MTTYPLLAVAVLSALAPVVTAETTVLIPYRNYDAGVPAGSIGSDKPRNGEKKMVDLLLSAEMLFLFFILGAVSCSSFICLIVLTRGKSAKEKQDRFRAEYARLLRECPDTDRQYFLSGSFRSRCDRIFDHGPARSVQEEPLPRGRVAQLIVAECRGIEKDVEPFIKTFARSETVSRKEFMEMMKYLELVSRESVRTSSTEQRSVRHGGGQLTAACSV